MQHHLYTFYLLSAFIVALFIACNLSEFFGNSVKRIRVGWDDQVAFLILFAVFVFVPVLNSLLVLYMGECYVWGRKKYDHP